MSTRVFFAFIFLGGLAALAGWIIIIFFTDPNQADWLIFSLFYASLLLFLSGPFFFAGNFFRLKFLRKQLIQNRLSNAWRQALFFAALIIGWAILKTRGLANIWTILLLILVLTALEFFFVSYQKQNQSYGREA